MRHVNSIVVVASLLGMAVPSGTGGEYQNEKPNAAGKADRWGLWRPLVGTWQGTSEGQPGKGRVKLGIDFVLKERFLKFASTADYENSRGGEHPEDFGFVSFDRGRSRFASRQFHSEGFVNQYTLTSDPQAGGKIELTSETCENAPPGWKGRESYKRGGDTLERTVGLAPPGKVFER